MKLHLAIIFSLSICSTVAYSQDEPAKIFIHSVDLADLTPEQDAVLAHIKSQKMNSNVETVRIDTSAFSAPRVLLNVSPTLAIPIDSIKADAQDGTRQWVGQIADSPNSASFIIRGENVTGTIQNKDQLYSIKPIGGGLHAIIEQDETSFPDEHPPQYIDLEKAHPDTSRPLPNPKLLDKEGASNDVVPTSSGHSKISVFVVYTKAVESVVVDPVGLIELAVKETNQSYANSQILSTIELSGTELVDYTETGNFFTDLSRLANMNDGVMDNVHSLRENTKADIVVLLINSNAYCGLADTILANADTAFAVVFQGCATGYYSFGHEIGHLQGARHNIDVDDGSPFIYGHGIILKNEKVRSVMAYNCPPENNCRRLPYWSNPDIFYDANHTIPWGTAVTENNARVLRKTWSRISAFR